MASNQRVTLTSTNGKHKLCFPHILDSANQTKSMTNYVNPLRGEREKQYPALNKCQMTKTLPCIFILYIKR